MATKRVNALIAEARQLSTDELAQVLRELVALQKSSKVIDPVPDYLSFLGSGKGCYATPEDADRFIREERDQ